MRKSQGISLALVLCVAGLFALLEQRRAIYFLSANAPAISRQSSVFRRFDYAGAFFMQKAEWAALDAQFKIAGRQKTQDVVAIIAVDEDSLKALHEWPWPRSLHARLIRLLEKAPPKALLFDIFFIEPFNSDPRGDRDLARATHDNPWVVHSGYFKLNNGQIVEKENPYPELSEAAHAIGNVNADVDEDGVLRRAFVSFQDGGTTSYLLSVLGASLYLNKTPDEVLKTTPLDAQRRMVVNYRGPEHTFLYIPYARLLTGDPQDRDKIAEALTGRVVLVGAQATGTYDHYPTPLSKNMPGVEFHANVIDNLIQGNALRSPGMRWTYLAIALLALLCGLVFSRASAGRGALGAVFAGVFYLGGAYGLFAHRNVVLDVAGPLMTLGIGYLITVIYRFFTEEREKRWVKAAFGQYVSPKVLDILMDDPGKLKLVGERREMTVFFSDVAGFTSISERLNPDELVVLLNRYLSAMTEVVFEFDGYLNKYMGDGIMAFWNAPVRQTDHAERACRAALKSMERLKALNLELVKEGMVPLDARIGLNSGVMVVGNMGSIQKSDYTVMGDNVNLGSRLEGANKSFGTSIMISEFTYEIVQEHFEVRFLDIIRVPGKAKPVKTYELLGEKGADLGPWPTLLPLYHQAIQEFVTRDFVSARMKFLEVLKILGHDKPCETYIQRSDAFICHPPPEDWDGVFELKVK